MTLNDVIALILRYFTEFCSFRGALRKSVSRCRRRRTSRSLSHFPMSFLLTLSETMLTCCKRFHRSGLSCSTENRVQINPRFATNCEATLVVRRRNGRDVWRKRVTVEKQKETQNVDLLGTPCCCMACGVRDTPTKIRRDDPIRVPHFSDCRYYYLF